MVFHNKRSIDCSMVFHEAVNINSHGTLMAERAINYKLKVAQLSAAKPKEKPYLLADGGGLYVEVLTTGSRVWRYIFSHDGKRPKMTIGTYPEIGISQARDRHAALRVQVANGVNPIDAIRGDAKAKAEEVRRNVTFSVFAVKWVAETLFYRSETYRTQILRFLNSYINPVIGEKILADVKPVDVLRIMEGLKRAPTTADRCRNVIQQVYNFAIRNLIAEINPAVAVRGAISVPPATHHRHLSEAELARFWKELNKQCGTSATTVYAAKILAYTMVRKSELRLAKWVEFDLESGVWSVPAERMKMRKPHRVYLPRQAIALLLDLQKMTGHGEYLLPMRFKGGNGRPMSSGTLNNMFGRLDFGVPEFAPHGLRSTAATILRENGFGRDVVELLLSHQEVNQVVAAYTHAELVDDRRKALQWYSDRIDTITAPAPAFV